MPYDVKEMLGLSPKAMPERKEFLEQRAKMGSLTPRRFVKHEQTLKRRNASIRNNKNQTVQVRSPENRKSGIIVIRFEQQLGGKMSFRIL